MAAVIFDSSTLISMSETCLVNSLYFLKEHFDGKFYVTPGVSSEVISRPLGIRKYEFSAMRIRKLFDDRVIEVISTPNMQRQTQAVLDCANHLFYVRGNPLQLVQLGEAECMAAFEGAKIDAMAVDEKTMRQLVEAPEQFAKQLAGEYAGRVDIDAANLARWRGLSKGIRMFRSSELLYTAGAMGFFNNYGSGKGEALVAGIHALRNAGCSLTQSELLDYERLGGGLK